MYDVIVVGGGVIGLSAARSLAKCGSKTLLIDQFPIPHSNGSSHGKSRAIQNMYQTYHHAEMMPEACKAWRQLEKETKSNLLIKTGTVCLCDDKARNTMAQNMNKNEVSCECELFSSDEIDKKFDGFKTCGLDGIYEPDGGVLKADDCLWALKTSFLLSGGQIEQGTVVKVEAIDQQTVKIHTNNEVLVTKSVILTCGPWINDLMKPLNLELPITLKRSLEIYWKTKTPTSYLNFPVTCVNKPTFFVYAVPVFEYPGYVKIGIHDSLKGPSLDHASDRIKMLDKTELNRENDQMETLKTLIKEHYPEVVPEPSFIQNNMYSSTPDEDFILDSHPDFSNIIIGAGFSGHGFKLAPVIGSILGKLALGKQQQYSLQPFELKRFADESAVARPPLLIP